MSLSFLSKKTWHTSNVKNVEQVWIAEQKKEKEEKKLKELQKQIDEERQIDELRTLQKESGLVTDPKQKVEWMYWNGVETKTSNLSSSVKSKSIRLIFGRIDCPRRALEAQQKSVRRNGRICPH
jgi:hypothetical protein